MFEMSFNQVLMYIIAGGVFTLIFAAFALTKSGRGTGDQKELVDKFRIIL